MKIFVGPAYGSTSNEENDSDREAWTSHRERKIAINLTRLWPLSGDYALFLDEFIDTIIHEFLHYSMHINKIDGTEETVSQLGTYLTVLSLGHLLGAGEEEIEEDRAAFQEWIDNQFKDLRKKPKR